MIISLCFVSCIVLEGVLALYLESIISTQWILHIINWSLDLWIMWLSSLRLKVPWTKIEGHAQTNQTHVGTSLVNYKSSYDNGLHKSLVVFMLSSFLQQANEPHMGSAVACLSDSSALNKSVKYNDHIYFWFPS